MMHKHLDLLGFHVVDRVTGASGVVTSIAFDLYGCVQAFIQPTVKDKKDSPECMWIDCKRLKTTSRNRVMDVPNFDLPEPGGEDKPPLPALPSI